MESSIEKIEKYLKEISKYSPSTLEEEREWGKKIKETDDDDAKQALTNANLRLVVSIAKKYVSYIPKGYSLLDTILVGNMGLYKAAEKYDYEKGHRFRPYATWWIRQAITSFVRDPNNKKL